MEIITSLENEKVKYWCKLNQKKYRDEEDLFLVEGEHLVLEALKAHLAKEVILDSEKLFPVDIPKHYVTPEILKKISNLNSAPDIMALCYKKEEKPLGNRLLLVDALQDPGNLGTIIRTCVAFHIDTIVLGENTVDLYNDKVIRASEGMIFYCNVVKRDLKTLIPTLQKEGYKVVGTKVTHGIKIDELKVTTKIALVIGNEGAGVTEEINELCDEYTYIPMSELCESLNVAMACGILLYQIEAKYNG